MTLTPPGRPGAPTGTVLLLPPHIAHTGRSGSAAGFRKRCSTLDPDLVDPGLAGGSSTSRRWPTTCCAPGSTSCTASWTSRHDAGGREQARADQRPDLPAARPSRASRAARTGRRAARYLPRQPAHRRCPTLREAGALLHADHPLASFSHSSSRLDVLDLQAGRAPRAQLRPGVRPAPAPLPRRAPGGGGAPAAPRRRADRPMSPSLSASTTRRTCTGTSPGWSGPPPVGSPRAGDRPPRRSHLHTTRSVQVALRDHSDGRGGPAPECWVSVGVRGEFGEFAAAGHFAGEFFEGGSSRVLSRTRRPSFRMMKWLPTMKAWWGLWVMNTTPRPASRAAAVYLRTTPDCLTPRAAVGSSRINTRAPK